MILKGPKDFRFLFFFMNRYVRLYGTVLKRIALWNSNDFGRDFAEIFANLHSLSAYEMENGKIEFVMHHN